MKHIHLETCESTQKYMLEFIKENNKDAHDFLVSCNIQTHGVGQKQNSWDSYNSSLCFSFTAKENEMITLTPLEVGAIICQMFNSEFEVDLKLKWPNDIMNESGEKVGGILIHKAGDSPLIIGVGLNLLAHHQDKLKAYDYKAGFIFKNISVIPTKEDFAKNIFKFFKKNRLTKTETILNWNSHCVHLNKTVTIKDGSTEKTGVFKGIGQNGQALITDKGETFEYYSGSLRILN